MFENLEIFKMAGSLARHAGQRQGVIAENIANSSTPNFKARDIAAFDTTAPDRNDDQVLRQTRTGHFNASSSETSIRKIEDKGVGQSPNGNSVSVEHEIFKSVEAERQHSRAMAIYQSSLNIIRTSIGRGR